MRTVIFWMLVIGVLGVTADTTSPAQSASELLVAAAANLSDVFTMIAQEFEQAMGIHVILSFGATGNLARQIENGAPFDLFAAADVSTIDLLVEEGLILPESRRIYARGRLILWWPSDSQVQLETLQDLLKPEIERIALANPEIAPYGRAAMESLIALGLWEAVQSKLVFADNVTAAKQFAATGNAEVAFIPISLVQPGKDRFVAVSGRLHALLDQALGIIQGAKNREAAERFSGFLASPEGQSLLEDFWYTIPCSAHPPS